MSLVTLLNQNIDRVIWEDAGLCDFDVKGRRVDVWKINVSDNLSRLRNIPNLLNSNELVRANRYMRDADRTRFFISRSALRFILSRYLKTDPAAIEFQSGDNSKPFIAGYPVHFNLSDSADWILIAISDSEIGADVEYMRPDFDYDGIIQSNFNAAEITYIEAENSLDRFFKLWTRKEAILKATGTGLTEYLHAINALDGTQTMHGDLLNTSINWKLSTFELSRDYPATIATGENVEKHHFYNFKF